MKLHFKLLAAFLITSLLIVLLSAGIMHLTVKKNFVRYVNNSTFDRMGTLFSLLEAHYAKTGNWDTLRDKRNWAAVMDAAAPEGRTLPGPPGLRGRPQREPGKEPGGRSGPPFHGRPSRIGPPRHGPPGQGGEVPLHHRLCLFDKDNTLVAGHMTPDSEFTFRDVTVNNETVGKLGLRLPPKFENPLGLAFLRQQAQSFILIACGILAIALVISWLLSRMLLAPVQELVKGTRALKSFDFDVEITPRSNDELGMLAKDFNRMARTIRQYETMRRNWLSDISHELRTPIAVLQSKLEAVQDGIRQMTPEMLASLHTDTKGLGKLVNNLHLLAMADSQGLAVNLETLDAAALLDRTLGSFRVRLEQKGIRIDLPAGFTPSPVRADAHHLGRVFANLLENSLRYTDAPGTLRITQSMKKNKVVFSFADSPPGVPEESLDRIFDRLFRVDRSRSRALGGSGLGLSICRQVAADHQGCIAAAPSGLGGLNITLELPLIGK